MNPKKDISKELKPRNNIKMNSKQKFNKKGSKNKENYYNKQFDEILKEKNNDKAFKINQMFNMPKMMKNNGCNELNKNQEIIDASNPLAKGFNYGVGKNTIISQINNNNISNQDKIKRSFLTPSGNDASPMKLNQNKNMKKNGLCKSHIIIDRNIKYFKDPPLIVIENNGNSSYIIVNLQIFANIRNISNYYLKNRDTFINNQNELPVSNSLAQIFIYLFPFQDNCKNASPNKISLKPFHELIIKLNPVFKGKTTKNAIDFLVYLLDRLHNEYILEKHKDNKNAIRINDHNNMEDYIKYLYNYENSIIFKTFAWINKKVEICWECKMPTIKYQKYFTYDLDFENAFNKKIINNENEISIEDCINYTSEMKNIYNAFCCNCNKKNNFYMTSSIYLSQSVLILLLREMENVDIIKKLRNSNIKININKNLDLSKLIENKKSFIKYTLHAIVYYDIIKKEYIAYCVSPINKRWYKYTNDQITEDEPTNFVNIVDDNILPVILFYRHI